jgi:hypothetical protein
MELSSILIQLAINQHNLYDILVYLALCIQCWTPDYGERNSPKHAEFYSKNKFEKLVNPVDFIIRIDHDAQSSECQIVQKFRIKPPTIMFDILNSNLIILRP